MAGDENEIGSEDMGRHQRVVSMALASCAICVPGAAAIAQGAGAIRDGHAAGSAAVDDADATGDIIVTARKRDETSISVPVAITAVGAAELNRRGITNIDAIARAVPALIVGEGGGTVQGGIIALRGLAGADTNPFGEQAVSFVIDGVQVARATVRRMSEMDMQQVEVLKGPQALFFGKNSPAGIISIRTADPTSTLEAKISAGYEFNAREVRTEGYISGPLTETLGARVSGYLSDMKGYSKYVGPVTGANVFVPESNRAPDVTDAAGRLTLKWEPGDRFNARFKFNYNRISGDASSANVQFAACPRGAPQGGNIDDCRGDDQNTIGSIGPNFGTLDSRFGNGHTFLHQSQYLSSLELNYDLNDQLTLTSVSGFYKASLTQVGNFNALYFNGGAGASRILASYQFFGVRELTEELRLTSNFDGPVNFMFGGLYQDTHAYNGAVAAANANVPAILNNYRFQQDGVAYSIFGQTMVYLLPVLELSFGARYSFEKKQLLERSTSTLPGAGTLVNQVAGIRPVRRFKNLSPEATLSYRPTQDLTIYASYKEGFLSGGFNATAAAGPAGVAGDVGYDQQLIRGFEGGIKARLLDGALRLSLIGYDYKTKGLQVTVNTQLSSGAQLQLLRNAGSVRTRGLEFDANYRTALEGLTLNGAVAYNRGRYIDYQASCYQGQSSDTCFRQIDRATRQANVLLQDLSGTQLVRAPLWTGNVGFNYEGAIGSGLKFGLSANASHSGGYFADVASSPGSRQRSYELYDATLRIMDDLDRWEAALIGRNLSNTHYFVRSTDAPLTGGAPAASAIANRADTLASISRGREVFLRVTYRFGK